MTTPPPPLDYSEMYNHLYIYEEITSTQTVAFMKEFRFVCRKLRQEAIMSGNIGKVFIHLHSYGGDLACGLAIYDMLRASKVQVVGMGEGCICSAASVIFAGCNIRHVFPSAMLLIHQLSAIKFGTHEEFKAEMDIQRKYMQRLVNIYHEVIELPKSEIRDMLKNDTWFDAAKMMELGFAHDITYSED